VGLSDFLEGEVPQVAVLGITKDRLNPGLIARLATRRGGSPDRNVALLSTHQRLLYEIISGSDQCGGAPRLLRGAGFVTEGAVDTAALPQFAGTIRVHRAARINAGFVLRGRPSVASYYRQRPASWLFIALAVFSLTKSIYR
jgi:hypothetical protein